LPNVAALWSLLVLGTMPNARDDKHQPYGCEDSG
jgi:hypothetical protein